MVIFGTLKLKTRLLQGGLPDEQAQAFVEALSDADVSQVATKADIEQLRGDMRTDIEQLRGDMRTLRWMMTFVLGILVAIGFRVFIQ